jgi:DNA primase
MWPIRDITGDVVGFGRRRLHEDDRNPAKYLNTAETPVYKKSTMLYGLDLAKREISRRSQAVVVEGYTDVMACHLSGVETAVATCGTAFGEDHIKVLRRVLMDQHESRGEVIFTFDGDAAGQKAAMKAFEHDQRFVAQTFVAVEPHGRDPCELRQASGPEAVRDLVARRVPLFEFAIRGRIRPYDIDTAEGRTTARRAGMDIVRGIRDVSLRMDYARQLAGWLGLPDPDELVAEARGGLQDTRRRRVPLVDPRDPELLVEREALKIVVQEPSLVGEAFDVLDAAVFRAPAYAAVREAVAAAGGASGGSPGETWVAKVRDAAADDTVRSLVAELAVESVHWPAGMRRELYAEVQLARLEELAITRRIAAVKSRLQRLTRSRRSRLQPGVRRARSLEAHAGVSRPSHRSAVVSHFRNHSACGLRGAHWCGAQGTPPSTAGTDSSGAEIVARTHAARRAAADAEGQRSDP